MILSKVILFFPFPRFRDARYQILIRFDGASVVGLPELLLDDEINLEAPMPRGDKSSYTDKQKRQAEHIEKGYEERGQRRKEAERRAWATVNKTTHGGKKSGSGRGKSEDHSPARKGGRIGGSSQSHASRVRAGKKVARTRMAER